MAQWRFERVVSEKLQGQVWRVQSEDRVGYFKFARDDQWRYSGPYIANEWITAKLARRLGLPVADLEVADVVGPDGEAWHGIVSVVTRADEVISWAKAPPAVRQRPEDHVYDVARLRQLVVFDVWVANVDRASGRNLVLYRETDQTLYRWYLIDHALTLLGAPYKFKRHPWTSPYWEDVWRYYHVPSGLLRLQSSWAALAPLVERIEQLPAAFLTEAVEVPPQAAMSQALRQETRALLEHRQRRLRKMIRRWLSYRGVKEYGV
ncbi:MAG: hypothetical protein K6T30_03745 [Alicyclobacillus sp.]|nr:hypothetical protein [Alicyclobacillus sp.]